MTTSGRRSEVDRRQRGLDLDRVLARRSLSAREIIDLIHEVNPTGRTLDKDEASRRYDLKRRLQSVLLQRFAEEMEVVPDEREGVVLLRHKFLGVAASHAIVADLDEQARAWVRLQLDLRTDACPWPAAPVEPEDQRQRHGTGHKRKRRERPLTGLSNPELMTDVAAALEAGRASQAEYDFEAARQAFERARALAPDEPAPLAALLDLLVNHLGLDEEAVDLAESVASAALDSLSSRAALALAAARLGDRQRALAWGQDLIGAPAAEVLRVLAGQALRAGDLVYAGEALERARYCLPTDPERILLQGELDRMRAAAMADEEAELGRLLATGFRAAAIELARRIVAAHPSSTPARALLRETAAQERRARQQEHLDQARAACGQGHFKQARLALAQARELGPHDKLAEIEQEIAKSEARAKQQAHEQVLEQLKAQLSNPASPDERKAGLAAYLTLDPRDRTTVRAGCASKELDWLDEIASRRFTSRTEELAGAVLAARTAVALLEADDPEAADKAVAAQRALLGDYDFGRALLARVERDRRARLQAQALANLEKARAALHAGDVGEAKGALDRITRNHLSGSSLEALDRLLLDLAAARRHRTCVDVVPTLLAKHRPLVAKQLVLNQLENGKGEEERAQLTRLLAEIDAKVRALHVGIDCSLPSPHLASDAPEMVTNCTFDRGVDLVLLPGGQTAALLSAGSLQLAVRLVDVDTGEVRRLLAWASGQGLFAKNLGITQGRLWMVNRFFQYLEISCDDWLPCREGQVQVGGHPADVLDKGVALPGSDVIWCHSRQMTSPHTRRLRAIDLASEAVIPTEDEEGEMYLIPGTDPPILANFNTGKTMFLVTDRGETATFIDLPEAASALTVARAPDGDGYLVLIQGQGETPLRLLCTNRDGIERTCLSLANSCASPAYMATIPSKRMVCLGYHERGSGMARLAYLRMNDGGQLEISADIEASGLMGIMQDAATTTAIGLCRSAHGITMTRLDDMPMALPASYPLFSIPHVCSLIDCSPPPIPALEDLIRSHALDPVKACDPQLTDEEMQKQARDVDRSPQALASYRLLCFAEMPDQANHLLNLMLEQKTRNFFVRLASAEREALAGRWVGDDLVPEAPTDAACEHLLHVRAVAHLKADHLDMAIACLDGHAGSGPCRLDGLLAMLKAVEVECSGEPGRAHERETPGVTALVHSVFAADRALARGDRNEALRLLDLAWIRRVGEAQSMARLAELYLTVGKEHGPLERFRASTLLSAFLDCRFTTPMNGNLWLGSNTWPLEKIEGLVNTSRAWLTRLSWKDPLA